MFTYVLNTGAAKYIGSWPSPLKNLTGSKELESERNERIVELVCHFKDLFRKLNCEASVWQIILPDFFGRHLSLHAMRLDAALVRTSYTISRGSVTLREFPVIKAR